MKNKHILGELLLFLHIDHRYPHGGEIGFRKLTQSNRELNYNRYKRKIPFPELL